MTRVVVVLLMLVSGSVALAQAPGETPLVTPAPVAAAPHKNAPHKDPGLAVTMSIATPLLGFALAAGGASDGNGTLALIGVGALYLGPSTGQWYGGRIGGIGLATRAVAAYAIVHGFNALWDAEGSDCLGLSDLECRRAEAQWKHDERVAETYVWTGLGLWVGSTVFDVVMAHRATTAWNREHALALTPTVMPATGGRAPGVSLSLTF